MAAYDLLEIYCELIAARLPIIESQKYVTFVTICDLQLLQFTCLIYYQIVLCICITCMF